MSICPETELMASSIYHLVLVGALAALSLFVLAYSLIIAQQILLGILAFVGIWLVYLLSLIAVRVGPRGGPEQDH